MHSACYKRVNMHIFTNRIEQYVFGGSICPQLQNRSQEYRVLATLKFFFPGKYGGLIAGDAPDLQDCDGNIGIEVTVAVPENDMKVSRLFSRLCESKDEKRKEFFIRKITDDGFTLKDTPVGLAVISPASFSCLEKKIFQCSIKRKLAKLDQYCKKFNRIELAVILPEPPTTDAEKELPNWLYEVLCGKERFFDYIHVISNRFYLGYDARSYEKTSIKISKAENNALCMIGRMTAEGVLSFESEEWN